MNFFICSSLSLALLVAPLAMPQSEEKSPEQIKWESIVTPKYLTWPAMKYVQENPDLPNVLLLGDSISIGYTARTRDALAGKANVFRASQNTGSTEFGLENIDKWLSWRDKWDVIHFNFGLHDLKRRKVGSPNPDQLDVSGEIEVPIEEYKANLEKIVARLKQTGAVLIWASTTPVPPEALGRIQGDEVKYNAVAAEVMKENGVKIDDLYTFITPRLNEAQVPPDVHFTGKGNEYLGDQVAAEILEVLPPAEKVVRP